MTITAEKPPRPPKELTKRIRGQRRATSLFSHGEPMVWLTGGALALALAMIVGLLGYVFYQGVSTFWPDTLVRLELVGGESTPESGPKYVMGEARTEEEFVPGAEVFDALPDAQREAVRARIASRGGLDRRRLLRVGNYELSGVHFQWVSDHEVASESTPEWALAIERLAWGRFYGFPKSFEIDGRAVADDPERVWDLCQEHRPAVADGRERVHELERLAIGELNAELEEARLELRAVELDHGRASQEYARAEQEHGSVQSAVQARFHAIEQEIAELERENARAVLVVETADGQSAKIPLAQIVRAYPANQLSLLDRIGVYLSRWWEFLTDVPRDNNNEGGVFPAIFGTVVMTLVMSLCVVPFGVLAALYLREYAKAGTLVSLVRIAVNNLAGVPSIVFGVFGLGFFCYLVGSSIDELLFEERLPNPTFGKGGLMWASLTLALLTLPVVIVATEEALAAVPSSMREGSYACGATKWQTIQRIVLPRAMPGIMTGMILAIARGAGEVAPLMLVGAVKFKPELAIDGVAPFLHPDRAFMHLGFHIYDLGFQSPNSEAAKPMVFTTTLLLIALIVVLNVAAISVRTRLRRRFLAAQM